MLRSIGIPRKWLFTTCIVIWLICLNWWVYVNYFSTKPTEFSQSIYEDFSSDRTDNVAQQKPAKSPQPANLNDLTKDSTVNSLFKKLRIVDNRGIDLYSTTYKSMVKKNSVNSILLNMNFQQRCDYYFKSLFSENVNWFIDPNTKYFEGWRDSYAYKDFKDKHMGDWKKEYAKENSIEVEKPEELPMTKELEDFIKRKYKEYWDKIMLSEQKITDFISHVRIFNKCYVTNDDTVQRKSVDDFVSTQKESLQTLLDSNEKNSKLNDDSILKTDSCLAIEKRIYPWLSFSYPLYERWTGEQMYSPPDYSKYLSKSSFAEFNRPTHPSYLQGKGKAGFPKSEITSDSDCFLTKFKNSLRGKGIVLSIGDKHVDDTVSLIKLLRALNNKYPIQIVYFDNLSKESKKKLVNAARELVLDLPQSFEKVQQYFPDDYLNADDGASSAGLHRQELWFVNVHHAIYTNYRGKFSSFGNKFFATLFSSFEEYILVDADAVLAQPPEFFFNLKGYQETGAYFYRDRAAAKFRTTADGKFFKKVSPSIVDQVMFDIPILTDKTLRAEYFDGLEYYMESGLVVIDRSVHFNSILMMMQLQLIGPAKSRSYGDKELFWLGFAVNGDQNYHFNEYAAAAIGQKTEKKYNLNKFKTERVADEICSCHPGHINGEDGHSLAWFNSGFQFCGENHRVDWEKEFEQKGRFQWLKDVDELKNLYYAPMKITHAVIPPFKNKWKTDCPNIEDEPHTAWFMDSRYCKSYLWCAYSRIGGTDKEGNSNVQMGELIEFDQKEQDLFDYYGDIWSARE